MLGESVCTFGRGFLVGVRKSVGPRELGRPGGGVLAETGDGWVESTVGIVGDGSGRARFGGGWYWSERLLLLLRRLVIDLLRPLITRSRFTGAVIQRGA